MDNAGWCTRFISFAEPRDRRTAPVAYRERSRAASVQPSMKLMRERLRFLISALGTLLVFAGAAQGCDHSESNTESRGRSDSRVAQARADLGLGSGGEDSYLLLNDDDHVPGWPRQIDPGDFREALESVRRSLALRPPEPRAELDRRRFQEWVDRTYSPWLSERGQLVRAAVHALSEIEDDGPNQVVVQGLVGLMLERFAKAIASLHLPTEIQSSSGDSILYRQAFLTTSEPLFDRAADAFGACAAASSRTAERELEDWRVYCDEHLENVQTAPRPIH